MEILSLECNGYNRIMLNKQFKKFTYTPDRVLQVIIGSNSSGKSSLSELMMLVPPTMDDIINGGYITITVDHNKTLYVITYGRDGKPYYSFKKEGVELNDGNKITMQKQLIAREFGLTKTIQDLLLGHTKFTKLTELGRRDWLVLLSDTDYNYVLGIWDSIRDNQKSTVSVLKHQTKRLATECVKDDYLLDNDELDVKLNRLRSRVDELITLKSVSVIKSDCPILDKIHLETLLNTLINTKKQIITLYSKSEQQFLPLNKLLQAREYDHGNLTAIDKELMLLSDELVVAENSAKEQDDKEGVTKDSIRSEIAVLVTKKNELLNVTKIKDNVIYSNLLADLTTVIDLIKEPIITLGSTAIVTSNTEVAQLTQTLNTIVLTIDTLQNELTNTHIKKAEQEYALKHNTKNCPNCNHVVTVGYDEQVFNSLIMKEKSLRKQLTISKQEKINITASIASNTDILSALDYVTDMLSINKDFDKFTKQITEEYPLRENPLEFFRILSNYKLYVIDYLHAEQLVQDINVLELNLETIKSIDVNSIKLLHVSIERLQRKISSCMDSKELLLEKIKLKDKLITLYEQYDASYAALQEDIHQFDTELNAYAEHSIQTAIGASIQELKLKLTEVEIIVNNADKQKALVADIKSQIKISTERKKDLDLLIKHMSPSKGFIGSTLIAFMRIFVNNINITLASIWQYPLTVSLQEQTDTSSISYKFPLDIDGAIRGDISVASAGTLDIINLAIRLTIMDALGMNNFPVVLDEFGSKFDKAHRDKAYKYISEVLSLKGYPQIFCITHYSELYTMFDPSITEFTVLHKQNVDVSALPNEINTAITLN